TGEAWAVSSMCAPRRWWGFADAEPYSLHQHKHSSDGRVSRVLFSTLDAAGPTQVPAILVCAKLVVNQAIADHMGRDGAMLNRKTVDSILGHACCNHHAA